MNKGEDILVVSYIFPPNYGVGGQRWAKLAKYLAKYGYTVHVLCHEHKKKDLQNELLGVKNIHTYTENGFYPTILNEIPNSVLAKIKYKLWQKILPFFCKGTIYDRAIFSEKIYLNKMREIITNNNIKKVMITTAPFSLAYFGALLKKELDFHLTIDIRDPWTWGKRYGYHLLNKKKKTFEKEREKIAITHSNIIISPHQTIVDYLIKTYKNIDKNNVKLIPHAFDTDDFELKNKTIKSNELSMIYAGSMYPKYANFLEDTKKVLIKLKKINNTAFSSFRLDIYSNDYDKNNSLPWQKKYEDKINFYGAIPPKKLFKLYKEFNYTLVYFPELYKDLISTKFYELIYADLKIIYIGYPGKLWDFIEQNNLGYCLHLNNYEQEFQNFLSKPIAPLKSSNFDIMKFSYGNVTKAFSKLIKTK